MALARFIMPAGYTNATLAFLKGAIRYKAFSGSLNAAKSSSIGSPTKEVLTLTFSAAPENNSVINVPDSNAAEFNTVTQFTYVYGGSPGAGVIPLVSGGGTAAQAATATQVALAAQLGGWDVTNPSAGVVVLVNRLPGFNVFITSGSIHILNMTEKAALSFGQQVPGRFGRNFCF